MENWKVWLARNTTTSNGVLVLNLISFEEKDYHVVPHLLIYKEVVIYNVCPFLNPLNNLYNQMIKCIKNLRIRSFKNQLSEVEKECLKQIHVFKFQCLIETISDFPSYEPFEFDTTPYSHPFHFEILALNTEIIEYHPSITYKFKNLEATQVEKALRKTKGKCKIVHVSVQGIITLEKRTAIVRSLELYKRVTGKVIKCLFLNGSENQESFGENFERLIFEIALIGLVKGITFCMLEKYDILLPVLHMAQQVENPVQITIQPGSNYEWVKCLEYGSLAISDLYYNLSTYPKEFLTQEHSSCVFPSEFVLYLAPSDLYTNNAALKHEIVKGKICVSQLDGFHTALNILHKQFPEWFKYWDISTCRSIKKFKLTRKIL